MRHILFSTFAVLLFAAPVFAQFKDGDPGGAKIGTAQTHKWQAGVTVNASAGPCRAVYAYVPVPKEWPEQTVKIASQDVSPGVKISFQTLDESAKLMVVRMNYVAGGEQAKALVTFECTRSMQLPPDDTNGFVAPAGKELTPALRRCLGSSPLVETSNAKIRKAAKETGVDAKNTWLRVEALYDYVRANVKYDNGAMKKGAAAALKDGTANHDDISALFVALCRDAGVPARMVWVPEFCYAEFYLKDKNGDGHWFPCSPAGAKAFGEMPDTKLILAKGDNFHPPEVRERQRYVKPLIRAEAGAPNAGRPDCRTVGQQVN